MREIEETSYNYNCFRQKKREFKTKRPKKKKRKEN